MTRNSLAWSLGSTRIKNSRRIISWGRRQEMLSTHGSWLMLRPLLSLEMIWWCLSPRRHMLISSNVRPGVDRAQLPLSGKLRLIGEKNWKLKLIKLQLFPCSSLQKNLSAWIWTRRTFEADCKHDWRHSDLPQHQHTDRFLHGINSEPKWHNE